MIHPGACGNASGVVVGGRDRYPRPRFYQRWDMSDNEPRNEPQTTGTVGQPEPGVSYRPVKGFPGYSVGDDGSLWSCRSCKGLTDRWRKLRPHLCAGYPCFDLARDGKHTYATIHFLVLTAFVGPRPDKYECLHWDGNPENNRLENLRWGTRSENRMDSIRHGTHVTPFVKGSKISQDDQREIRARNQAGESTRKIAQAFGIGKTTVWLIISKGGAYATSI